jgi:hypothetical protein
MIVEPMTNVKLEDNINLMGKIPYSVSSIVCVPILNQSIILKPGFVTKGMISYWIDITGSICRFSLDQTIEKT